MATIALRGNPVHTSGDLPKLGGKAPDFKLVTKDLKDVSLADYKGKKKVLNIYPSIDTPVCAISTRKFNEHAKKHADTVMLMVSADLPFSRFSLPQKRPWANGRSAETISITVSACFLAMRTWRTW